MLEGKVFVIELGARVIGNEHNEWRVAGSHVRSPSIVSLSTAEREERDYLELTVQQAFYVAGQALRILRDKKLYRETHATFKSYVQDQFGYKKSAAYYLIGRCWIEV